MMKLAFLLSLILVTGIVLAEPLPAQTESASSCITPTSDGSIVWVIKNGKVGRCEYNRILERPQCNYEI